jgi:hypothetical protein
MSQVQYLAIELMALSRLERGPSAPRGLWSADADPQASDAIDQRNRRIAERLRQEIPDLVQAKGEYESLDDYADDDLSQEAVLRRYHRSRVLAGPWRGGELIVQVYDDLAAATIPVTDPEPRVRAALKRDLEGLIETLIATTGMTPWDPQTGAPRTAAQAAAALLDRSGPGLDRLARAQRWEGWHRRLGLPSLILLTLIAFALAVTLAWSGVHRGTLMAGADGAAPLTFITEVLVPPATLGFGPDYALEGRIAGGGPRVRLPVDRAHYIAAGRAAPYTVLGTGDPATPYVLRSAFDAAQPVLRLGPLGVAWTAWLALAPLALWYGWIVRPLLRVAPQQRGPHLGLITRKLIILIPGGILLAAVAWLRSR